MADQQAAPEMHDARDFASSIVAGIPLPLVVIDSDFRIRSANEAFCTLAGSNARSLLEDLRASTKDAADFEFEYQTSDESSKVFLVRGRVLEPDRERFVLLIFEDCTAHNESERLLKAESTQLASQVESTTRELERSREDLRALTGNLLTSQEEERRRLARDLHDDISQRLAALNMLGDQALASIANDPQLAREKLLQTLSEISRLADDVRTLTHRLHPSTIEHLGLAAALRMFVEEFGQREQRTATFTAREVPENLPQEIATGLYRIAQEALRNVAKHAGKTPVTVTLTGAGSGLQLQVEDSGRGFETEKHGPGLGLISIRERARLIGATLNIQSASGEGTKVTVTVPLPAAARNRKSYGLQTHPAQQPPNTFNFDPGG